MEGTKLDSQGQLVKEQIVGGESVARAALRNGLTLRQQ
jgi:hypothetical protein